MANFNGTSGDDVFTGGEDNEIIIGNGGNDQLSGGGGNDTIEGNAGADTLNGGDGDDILFSYDRDANFSGFLGRGVSYDVFAEIDTLIGGAGDDYIFAGVGDNVDGGAVGSFGNRLYISFMGATSGVQADFRPLQSQSSIIIAGATISNIQNIGYLEGSNYDDFLVPIDTFYPTGADVFGRGGNDQIVASYYSGWSGGGLYGGDGDDIVDGRPSQYSANVYGDAGNDTLYTSTNGFGVAYGGDGNDIIYSHGITYGGAGNDVIILQDTFYKGLVYGEAGDDQIHASSGGNNISGGAGADNLLGSNAADTLASGDFVTGSTPTNDMGQEHDILAGLGDNDLIAAGYGDDADGGSGSDTLRYSLGGATSGVTFNTAGIVSGTPFVFAGGTINSFETFAYLRGSEFADTLNLATQSSLLTVDGGAGDDVFVSNGSSVAVAGGNGSDRFVSGIAGDIFDGGDGTDTVDYQGYGAAVTVTLGLAAGSTGTGPGGDQLLNVENVEGSVFGDTLGGSDQANVLRGNSGNDTLRGNGGADILIGGTGDDTMEGGLGNDDFQVDDAGDVVTEAAGQGDDRIITSVSYVLAASSEVETIETSNLNATTAMSLTGSSTANMIRGNNGGNVLRGEGGNDGLFGMGGADTLEGGNGDDILDGGTGTDGLYGGAGNDTYFFDSSGDFAVEQAGEGADVAYTTVTYALNPVWAVEVLAAADPSGTAAIDLYGNELDNELRGNAAANFLIGDVGNDVLLGLAGNDLLAGGSGADYVEGGVGSDALVGGDGDDTLLGGLGNDYIDGNSGADGMYGGAGDDVYFFDNFSDFAIEFAGEGNDRIYATFSFGLVAGAEIELVAALDTAGTAALDFFGNERGNTIWGNNGSNLLIGGAGDDVLEGFDGNDTLLGDQGRDYLNGSSGDDVIDGGADGDTLFGGEGNDFLTGAPGEDQLIGGAGNDTLNGGADRDFMSGEAGDDTYYIDDVSDQAVESAGNGHDIIYVNVGNYGLLPGAEIEIVSALDNSSTTLHVSLAGNEFANQLWGSNGINQLVGRAGNDVLIGFDGNDMLDGGSGNDYLDGGNGSDAYRFRTSPGTANADTIANFVSGSDKVELDFRFFKGIDTAPLDPGMFVVGTAAADANDFIIYDQATGRLFYDADGNGSVGAELFATLTPGTTLAATDIVGIF